MSTNIKTIKRERLHRKIRSLVSGTAERPRLVVFRSNRFMYAQLIDDVAGKTLVSASDIKSTDKANKVDRAKEVGKTIATLATKAGITKVVFDRGGFKYGGRVKALADSARENGLVF